MTYVPPTPEEYDERHPDGFYLSYDKDEGEVPVNEIDYRHFLDAQRDAERESYRSGIPIFIYANGYGVLTKEEPEDYVRKYGEDPVLKASEKPWPDVELEASPEQQIIIDYLNESGYGCDLIIAELVLDRCSEALRKLKDGEDLSSTDWTTIESSSTYVACDLDSDELDSYSSVVVEALEVIVDQLNE